MRWQRFYYNRFYYKFFFSIKGSAELTELSSKFLTVLYDPFKQLIKSYGKFESTRLQRELEAIKLTSIDNLESVQLLGLSVSKLITNAEKAIERCQQLTFGCGFQQLNEALNVTIVTKKDFSSNE